MADDAKTIMIEDARIIFRNFQGREGPYNKAGDPEFSVVLDPEDAEQMLADGWNVKYLQPRDEGDDVTPYMGVAVNFKNRPPRVYLITSTSRTQLDEKTIEVLDGVDIKTVDMILRGYDWVVNDKSGTKAYLQSLFVTIEEDALEQKYKINQDPPRHGGE